jgi:hypothetical protein
VALVMVIGLLSVRSPVGARASAGIGGDATLPPGRGLGGMALDPTGNVILFGGYSAATSQQLGDTWIWDGTSWMERHPADSPSPRSGFAMAYDGARHQVVLFGGSDGYTSFDDTWVWNGVNWTEQHPAQSPPPTNIGQAMAYDAARRQVVLSFYGFSNQNVWLWNGVDWRDASPEAAPPGRFLPQQAYDFARKRVVLFGGAYSCFEDLCAFGDTWLWNGINWKELKGIQHPPGRYSHAMAYDYRRHTVVVFGGNGGVGGTGFKGDTWTWHGPDWVRADPVRSPLPREAAMMSWDPQRRVLLLFGGRDAPVGNYRDFQDTWTLDGTYWTCVAGCS